MESWDSMVKVTYHDLYTICASEGTAACWNSAGWVTQTSISKWRPWTWPRTAAIAWGPSWCRLCSLSVPWLLGVAASKHFSCNIKKNNLHPVLNFFQATCYPIFFHFEQQRHFFQILVVWQFTLLFFFPAPLRESRPRPHQYIICLFNVRFCHICGLWLRTFCMDPGSDQDWLSKCEKG